MSDLLVVLIGVAAQAPAGGSLTPEDLAALEPTLWPYFIAIGALASACTFMFGVIVKASRDHAKQIEEMSNDFQKRIDEAHAAHRKADEEKSKRVAEEFQKKDAQLLDWATKASTMLERVANELARIGGNDGR